jgi:predicted RNA-binding Zn-ribbon protein involved in translation (DUF1610 family)
MVSGVHTTVVFICPKCGLSFQATQERNHGRPPGLFNCTGCGAEVHTWFGKYDYTRWQAFDLKRQTNGLSSAGPIAPTSRWRSP